MRQSNSYATRGDCRGPILVSDLSKSRKHSFLRTEVKAGYGDRTAVVHTVSCSIHSEDRRVSDQNDTSGNTDSNDHPTQKNPVCSLAQKTGPVFHTLHNTCHRGASHIFAHIYVGAPTYKWNKTKSIG